MKLVACTLPYKNFPLERALQGIAKAGYRYVGIGFKPHNAPALEATERDLEDLRALFQKYGLEPATMLRLVTVDKDLEAYKRQLELAAALGVRIVTDAGIGGYNKFPDEPKTAEEMAEPHKKFVAAMKEAGAYAAQLGITIVLKPHTGNTATAGVLLNTLADIGSPAVKAFYDPGNVRYYEGVDPVEDIKLIQGDMPAFCAKDHRGPRAVADFPAPGKGECGFRAIFAYLKAIGFDGVVTVERVGGSTPVDSMSAEDVDALMLEARESLLELANSTGMHAE